ncbi:hypothetical protein GCM10025771_15900 [Niveibacterium umoris]|uniref:Uncharacterized protein n=1 Tax=Niveibacterium umoris TaxID=1193620 RepID=A0A840BNI5_9RHOO|nr:hypothetical protein [Niveibacterium umoris]MBB4014540.1 hypothetical protein [Niveibacterium umoris]
MTEPRFVRVRVGSYLILHGFDENNAEITEAVAVEGYADKLVAVDRIKSVSERYLLTDYADGRLIYWEYEGGLQALESRLATAGLVI